MDYHQSARLTVHSRAQLALTVVNIFTRESLAIEVGQSLKGEDVVRTLNRLKQHRGAPRVLFCDNGPEFTGQLMDLWAYRHGVKIDFSRPGKPTDKRYFYDNHDQLKAHLTDFLRAYNFARRLKTLKGLKPYEFLCKLWTQTPDRFTLNPIHQMPGLNT